MRSSAGELVMAATRHLFRFWFASVVVTLCLLPSARALASQEKEQDQQTLHIAVAANFRHTLNHLLDDYQRRHHPLKLSVSAGSSGTLYSQILHGAPFDLFLSADSERPELLEQAGLGISSTRFTYAQGILALWQAGNPGSSASSDNSQLIQQLQQWSGRLAIANPRLAPYGEAAQQTLEALDLWPDYQARLLKGSSIAQAYQYLHTGNARLGLVALSQLQTAEVPQHEYRTIPLELHQPIEQQALRLTHARSPDTAQAFLDYLQSADAQAIIEQAGYRVPR